MTDLSELLERCRKATGPDGELDDAVRFYFDPTGAHYYSESSAYTGSIDAVLALVERRLGERKALSILAEASAWADEYDVYASIKKLPLAILTALLTALGEQQ